MKNLIFTINLIFIFASCQQKSKTSIDIDREALMDKQPAECAYLTKDQKGNTVVSWVRIINDSTTAFCYAMSPDGKYFSEPIVIPNSSNIQPHGENIPKIIFKPSGEIIALWGIANKGGTNKYAGLVFYTQSFDDGKNWTPVTPLVNDTSGHDQRYYDIANLPNGETGIIWLDNRKNIKKEGSALYYATTNGKQGFGGEKLISEPCCQCCRTDLFVDSTGGIHALFRGIIEDSIRDMVHIVSVDGGKTFSERRRINEDNWVIRACPHTGPSMAENNTGLHFAWYTGGSDPGCFYCQTTDNGKSFKQLDRVNKGGSHPQLISTSKDKLLIAWDENAKWKENNIKRIAVQLRNQKGESLANAYLTDEQTDASYPVLSALQDGSVLVAYTVKKEKKNYVYVRRVNGE